MSLVTASKVRLPHWYDSVETELCEEPLSVDLEIARWLAAQEQRRGYRATTVFCNIVEYPECQVIGNPYPRQVILDALGLDPDQWQEQIWQRSQGMVARVLLEPKPWAALAGLDAIPVLRHRPGDAGRYITAGVTVCRSLSTGRLNLGVYRVQIVNRSKGRIFFDPRTDAYRNWQESVTAGKPLPVAIFLGADPVYILAAAARLPADHDDFRFPAIFGGKALRLEGEPPVPVESSYVIRGVVTGELETEGPFAEFKGYYVDARKSPVLEVHQVLASVDPLYPTIVTGAESGLTLMALQNEYLLYCHLRNEGFPVRHVHYLLESRAEFTALIDSDAPSLELVQAAMNFDRRSKVVLCGPHLERPWDSIATHGFQVLHEPYYRKGKVEGERIGLVLDRPPAGRPVEY